MKKKDGDIQAQLESGSSGLSSIDAAEEDGGFWTTRMWIRFLTKLRWYPNKMPYVRKVTGPEIGLNNSYVWWLIIFHQVFRPSSDHKRLRLVNNIYIFHLFSVF